VKTFTANAVREDEWWVVTVDGVGTTQGRTRKEAAFMAEDLVIAALELDPEEFAVAIKFSGEDQKTCNHADWEHELFDGCPPPLPPRSCCGAPAEGQYDDPRWCFNGNCIEYFCAECGAFQGLGHGPVGCGCADHRAWHKQHPEQRPKRPVTGGKVVTRKYRARQGR
jgi:hypothetical protein